MYVFAFVCALDVCVGGVEGYKAKDQESLKEKEKEEERNLSQ